MIDRVIQIITSYRVRADSETCVNCAIAGITDSLKVIEGGGVAFGKGSYNYEALPEISFIQEMTNDLPASPDGGG